MKNILIVAGVAVAALAGLALIGRPADNAGLPDISAAASGAISAAESSHDFGSVSMAQGNVNYSFKVKNASDQPLTLTKIYTSCMCTTAKLVVGDRQRGPFGMPGHNVIPRFNETLAAGGEAVIEVIFDPAAHGPAGVGKIERSVYLENAAGAPLELKITANVTP